MLELKRGGPARVQTEMLEFIALLIEFSSKLKNDRLAIRVLK